MNGIFYVNVSVVGDVHDEYHPYQTLTFLSVYAYCPVGGMLRPYLIMLTNFYFTSAHKNFNVPYDNWQWKIKQTEIWNENDMFIV